MLNFAKTTTLPQSDSRGGTPTFKALEKGPQVVKKHNFDINQPDLKRSKSPDLLMSFCRQQQQCELNPEFD
jgi:hypothetical protein